MKILYLIGNGFDLAQGLSTRYSDFYESRVLKAVFNPGILKNLQGSIKSDVASWADMEKRLGEFTSEMGGLQDVDDVYDYLRRELRSYLASQQVKVFADDASVASSRKLLLSPEAKLLPESADAVRTYIKTAVTNTKSCDIDVISFNYTDVFERAFAYKGKPIALGKEGDVQVNLKSVHKLHGALNKEMVMGVADAAQITNKSIASDIDALDVLVKPRTTALRRDFVTRRCEELIKRADIIVMFGLSIGETDRNWWKLITDRLQTNGAVRLIIYGHLQDSNLLTDYPRLAREERKLYKKLYACNGVTDLKYNRLNQQIFVSFDDSMFQGIMIKK